MALVLLSRITLIERLSQLV